jgi:hypothetical protein
MGRDEAGTRFNIFRRFREAVLQRSEARQILIDYWMGHSSSSMGDRIQARASYEGRPGLRASSITIWATWAGWAIPLMFIPLVDVIAFLFLLLAPGQKARNVYGDPPIFLQRLRKLA